MKLLRPLLLLPAMLLIGCVGPYDYQHSHYPGDSYASPVAGSSHRSNDDCISPMAALALGLGALYFLSPSDDAGPTSASYDRCEYCSEPVGFSGRWCDHHAAVVQAQMREGR